MMKYKLKIKGLDCANCANELEEEMKKINTIKEVSISFMSERLTFECNEKDYEKAIDEIKKTIKKVEPDSFIEGI